MRPLCKLVFPFCVGKHQRNITAHYFDHCYKSAVKLVQSVAAAKLLGFAVDTAKVNVEQSLAHSYSFLRAWDRKTLPASPAGIPKMCARSNAHASRKSCRSWAS